MLHAFLVQMCPSFFSKSQRLFVHKEVQKLIECMRSYKLSKGKLVHTVIMLTRHFNRHRGRSFSGGRANIHIFVFTDLENNGFEKKFITQNTNI